MTLKVGDHVLLNSQHAPRGLCEPDICRSAAVDNWEHSLPSYCPKRRPSRSGIDEYDRTEGELQRIFKHYMLSQNNVR